MRLNDQFYSDYKQQMTHNKPILQQHHASKLKSDQLQPQQLIIQKLKLILSSLLHDKQALDLKFHHQRILFLEQINLKERNIETLQSQNNELKRQKGLLLSEIGQLNDQLELMKKGNGRMQAEIDGMRNVLQYLQGKNRELTESNYELTKMSGSCDKMMSKYENKFKKHINSIHNLEQQSIMDYCQIQSQVIPSASLSSSVKGSHISSHNHIHNNIHNKKNSINTMIANMSCYSEEQQKNSNSTIEIHTLKKAKSPQPIPVPSSGTKMKSSHEVGGLQLKKNDVLKKSKGALNMGRQKQKRQAISKSHINNLLNGVKCKLMTGRDRVPIVHNYKSQTNIKRLFHS